MASLYSIGDMRRAVAVMHGAPCAHESTGVVHEQRDGVTVWRGVVETSTLEGHAKATKAYCMAWEEADDVKYIAVLNVPPVDSPREAVKAALTSGRLK